MGLFHTDSVALSYSNVEAAKQWWIDTFGCKVVRVPADVDGRKARKLKGFRLRTTKLNRATSQMKKVVMSVFENISTPNLNE